MTTPSDSASTASVAATSTEATPEAVPQPSAPAYVRPEDLGNVDALMQSTARFSRPAWDAFLAIRQDWAQVAYKRFRFAVQANSVEGASTLAQLLEAVHVTAIKQETDVLRFITTFAKLQTVIKHDAVAMVDAVTAEVAY